ncbi:ABC transporter substrate-binding protein [Streptacidiphilus sp. PB12-B1b]|uniref:ABC transporter substrate-binding protein n=1 Tax=Streptacidiphilus sp. PB12-B1b TaxID=2705012 RepID=UPI0015FD416E|nr:ABC transporter substrate-binding protein [Streptacidiphilus sp. PB12-B1b]QMU78995.1 ABC transporter substrate-binding protein [Streptacidiphilus sp. PB12-B1b]
MMRKTRTVTMTAIAISVALGATACGGGSSSSSGAVSKGGTLVYYTPSDFDHLDSGRTYTTQGQNIGREIYRTLTGWTQSASSPNAKPTLTGDLATNTGVSSNGAKTWTFTLRSGIKWQDGTPVTSADVKYGVERTFDPDLSGGPTYAQQWLANDKGYKGPTKSGDLASIQTPNASTIVFQLNQPVSDFNEATAMGTFAAVPKAHDTGATYDTHVYSDGPYEVKSYTQNKELILVKNPEWSQATDPLRNQNVDEIDIKMGMDQAAIDQLMKADGPDAENAVIEDPIAGTDLNSFVNDPTLKSRLHAIPAPGTNYLAMNTTTIKNLAVRQAIEYAINKETIRGAFGGSAYGQYATVFLPPGTDGRQDSAAPYGTNPAGDPAKAKALLAQAGVKNLTLSLAVEATPTQAKVGSAIADALAQVGITVNIKQIDRATYFNTVGNTSNKYDLIWGDWIADWPNASTILPPLFDGRQIQPQGNQVFSQLQDPAAEKQMDAIDAMADPAQADAAWGALDVQLLQKDAAVVPLVYMTFYELQGKNVGGLTNDSELAEMNLAHVYLKK